MDVERLIGSLLRSGMGRKGVSRSLRRAAFSGQGLTLLAGIGIAAYEHFRSQGAGGAPAPAPAPASGPATPPPFPGATPTAAAQPGPPPPPQPDLLLQAMVQAALADGVLDAAEREAIQTYLSRDGVTEAERAYFARLLADPGTIDDLAARVQDPGTAAEVWAAARMAIDADTEVEQDFLRRLGERLGLDGAARADIEARLVEAGAA